MKLNVGENIRRLRRGADMTQEQLADKLGVAYQSVSRWENGTTYPDIEFLPSLAGIFGVTVDELIGCEEVRRNDEIEKKIERFHILCSSEDTTAETLLPILRELHKDCLPVARVCEDVWRIFTRILNGYPEIKKDPSIIKELRDISEELLSRPIPQWLRDSVIYDMAHLEDETYIGSFLDRYATKQDLSVDTLLHSRYLRNGQWEKAEALRLKKLYGMVTEMVFGRVLTRLETLSVDEKRQVNTMMLAFLHNMCGVTPDSDYPITGDGTVDIFVKHRLWLGYRAAAYHAADGETERAFVALEDTVTMLESFMRIPEDAVIPCKGVCLEGIAMKKTQCGQNGGGKLIRYSDETIGVEACMSVMEAVYPLTQAEEWRSFDPIRDDPRFASYVDRVKAVFALDSTIE